MEINPVYFRAKCCKAALGKIQNTAFTDHPEETLQYVYGVVDMVLEIDEWIGSSIGEGAHDN